MLEPALQTTAIAETHTFVDKARMYYGPLIRTPEIRFDLRGRSAGQVRIHGTAVTIRYNPSLFQRHPTAFLRTTPAHEVAHLVVHAVYGPRVRPHGPEWRSVMAYFGVPAQRTHDFPVQPARTLRRYAYVCNCREHYLTSIRHNRVVSGRATYHCRACGAILRRSEP